MSMRLLGVDLGDKRTGLATGDTATGTVFPLDVLHVNRGDALLKAVSKRVQRTRRRCHRTWHAIQHGWNRRATC